MQKIEFIILSEADVRAIVRHEIQRVINGGDAVTVTQKQAMQMFRQFNLPTRKSGYVTLKRLMAEGIIRSQGRRLMRTDVLRYIAGILGPLYENLPETYDTMPDRY